MSRYPPAIDYGSAGGYDSEPAAREETKPVNSFYKF
jgi:hypothetical protein